MKPRNRRAGIRLVQGLVHSANELALAHAHPLWFCFEGFAKCPAPIGGVAPSPEDSEINTLPRCPVPMS